MVTLGLLPPYSEEDVHEAYRTKAKTAHPDAGGDAVQFVKLHEAYERAMEYIRFHGSRRAWIGARVLEYIQREKVIAEVHKRGGRVDLEHNEWIKTDLGEEFAQLVDKVVGIHLCGPRVGDEAMELLVREQATLQTLAVLDLSGSRISDQALGELRVLTNLRGLDLSGTAISRRGLKRLLPLPHLQWIRLGRTRVHWWSRMWLRWSFPGLLAASPPDQVGYHRQI
jgi:hypothetical protein